MFTDGAAAMNGKHSGTVTCIKEKVTNITQMHCTIYREVPVAKHLGKSLFKVLFFGVKIVNSIKPYQIYF